MTPDMGPYIALAWAISATSLSAITLWSLWRYLQRKG